ncbi:hypothetical protein FHS04_002825 [Mesoflavibacter sabulilitoris]|uniref:Uncharacterized protein n=1 Tax=Mesoflavibacter zeaxanthinifaciens subsp. sabulilitoris TaxID=1520893 RepID=A0A2T1NNQ0_9FLAO|nr:hypothetical protein [Mesoflavibacter zeaxanthinifaciens]MBB3125281.1 hypothetical protein [Mesoflavibacter zeaxanthinifaciens subsp. sabulilitoris]PSG94517.1 hypothetical protein C7H61_00860 [Mesoflavibacter zeaxanthinifaciens subsp. sabulilitoris]
MKIYTIPLKVFIYAESFGGTCVRFCLPKGKVFYTVELLPEYGIKDGKIIGRLRNKEYYFDINTKVLCDCRYLKDYWDTWKNGERFFNQWFIEKKDVL